MSKFIVLEGIDRSGKTTQIDRLYHHLKATTNLRMFTTRQPWSMEVRERLKNENLSPKEQLDLILKDRAKHCELIKAMLQQVDLVLCDRFTLSTIAYQGYGHKMSLYELNKANEIVTQGLVPDLTIVLDCPLDVALKRGHDKPLDKMEKNVLFLERVKWAYVNLAREFNHPLVDGSQSEDEVLNDLLKLILPLIE